MQSLKPENAARSRLASLVFADIETNRDPDTGRWDDVVCVCSIDDDGAEVRARSIAEAFESWESAGYLAGAWTLVAHWGGIFDFRLIVDWSLRNGWTLDTGQVSGGFGLWSATLRKGSLVARLTDSARIVPTSLDKAARELNLVEKKDTSYDRRAFKTFDDGRTVEYCMRDCRVLRSIVGKFRAAWESLGVGLRATAAAGASAALRLHVPDDCWGWTPEQDAAVAPAYYGGRVEVFRRACDRGWFADVVSSYPAAMSRPLPTRHLFTRHRAADPGPGRLGIVCATVHVPDVDIGPLPYRPAHGPLRDRLVFPTGEFRGTWTHEELTCAVELGLARIRRVHATHVYDAEPWAADYMRHWFAVKAQGGAFTYPAKIALNSASGKLCERPERTELTGRADTVEALNDAAEFADMIGEPLPSRRVVAEYRVAGVPVWDVESFRTGSLRHMAAAAHVTGRGREVLLRRMVSAGCQVYCDTDSVFAFFGAGLTRERFATGLGEFAFESVFTDGEFLRPKVYAYRVGGELRVRAKGFRMPDGKRFPKALESAWNRIRAGKSLAFQPAAAVRRGMAHGDIGVRRDRQLRRFNPDGIDKRFFFSDGTSRPWNIRELEDCCNVDQEDARPR